MGIIRAALVGVGLLSALLLAYGLLPPLHPSVNTASLLRPGFAVLCLFGAFAAWRRPAAIGLAAAGVAGLAASIGPFLPQPPGDDLRVYAKNVRYRNAQLPALAADIVAADVDLVLLQEVSERNDPLLLMLAESHPHLHLCRFSGWSGIAVLSRHPFDGPGVCSRHRAVAAVPIVVDGARVWAASIHIPWPWPTARGTGERGEAAAHEVVAALDGPVVMGGDFNAAPYAVRVRSLARAADIRLAGPARVTYRLRGAPLSIDAILAPGGGRVTARPRFGSDHFGLVADLSLAGR